MKRLVALFLCVSIIFSFASCSSGKNKSAGSTSESASAADENPFEPTSKTISVSWFVPWWMDASDFDYIFDDFARKYPDYTIEKNAVPDLPTLLASIQAGNQPDIWMGGDPNTTNFVSGCYQSLFTCLDPYLEKDPVLNSSTLDQSQMSLTEFFGKHYALPYLTSQFCLVYNKKLFEQAGIDPNTPPKTWTEFYNYAKKLTKFDSNGKVTQLGVIDGPYQYQMEVAKGHSSSIADNGIDSNINSDWILKVNQYCSQFDTIVSSSNAMPDGVKFTLEGGNAAMTANGNLNYLNVYAQAGIDFGIAKMPMPDDGTEQVIPALLWYYFSIPKGAQNPNGGWLFAKYAMTDGLYQSVANDFQKNPTGLLPQYIAQKDTREKVYNTFLSNLPDNLVDLIKQRDQMETEEFSIMKYSPIHSTLLNIENKWNEKQQKNEVGLKEKLEGIHNEYESDLATWKNSMISQGWQFPEGQDPIPPANYGQ